MCNKAFRNDEGRKGGGDLSVRDSEIFLLGRAECGGWRRRMSVALFACQKADFDLHVHY